MADSRITSKAPLRILCQGDHGSCAACCGVYNFVDRSRAAVVARLQRRTELVRAAWPEPHELAVARDTLLAEERPTLLFSGVKVCPYAGFVDDDPCMSADEGEPLGRIGCLLHPTRHPEGADLRDLAVYPREVCAGHFCAPHDWLRPREATLAQTARGLAYGRVVTDAGLVKAVARGLDERLGRAFVENDVGRAGASLGTLWHHLLEAWPWVDGDPRRFGGFLCAGDDAIERSLPSCLAGLALHVPPHERTILDAIGTRALDADDAREALSSLRRALDDVAAAMGA